MSLRANIEHLEAAQGVEAVAVIGHGENSGPREFRGSEAWTGVLDGALSLLKMTDESTIRMVIGKHTVVVQTEREETVAVLLPTGHAIAKSLRRMIRRMSRKIRPPLRPEPAVEAAPTPTVPAPTPTPVAVSVPSSPISAPDAVPPRSPWG